MKTQTMKRCIILVLVYVCIQLSFAQPVQTSREAEKQLSAPVKKEGFNFMVFGDRTGSDDAKATIAWGKAIQNANRMQPSFVMTVGDLIQGYEGRESWLQQKDSFLETTNKLTMPWYPAAGNHDIYWMRNTEGRPNDHHESDYETHFGPLWYTFEHENCRFIVLFSDEGDPISGEKATGTPALQKMSDEQFTWLTETLDEAKDAEHVFLFLHHPRWRGGGYGDDWNKVHRALVDAGNVSAVFAGHTHSPAYQQTDGIDYYTLGTTGGVMSEQSPIGRHLFYWVSVQRGDYHIIGVPLDSLIDPQTK